MGAFRPVQVAALEEDLVKTLTLPKIAVLLFAAAQGAPSSSDAHPAYVRWPDLHGNRVVFCAEGDLWLVADTGGIARRLTNHPGNECFPHWSPDGKWIAFTGDYDGNSDVYVIPSDGGEPKRLTWHPSTET